VIYYWIPTSAKNFFQKVALFEFPFDSGGFTVLENDLNDDGADFGGVNFIFGLSLEELI
jgi:hypothetical protein